MSNGKVSPALLDMPLQIANQVFAKLDSADLVRCRKVCRSMKYAVDKFGIRFKRILVSIFNNQINLHIDGLCSTYTQGENGVSIVTYLYESQPNIIEGENYVQLAFKNLEVVLKHVIHLSLSNDTNVRHEAITSLINVFKSKKCIHVKELHFSGFSFNEILLVLPYCNPLELNKIDLHSIGTVDQFERIAHLAQWNNARVFNALDFTLDSTQIETMFHFEWFSIGVNNFSIENAIQLRDIVIQKDTFQFCSIRFPNNLSTELARLFQPAYTGESTFRIAYGSNNGIFEISCEQLSHFLLFIKRLSIDDIMFLLNLGSNS